MALRRSDRFFFWTSIQVVLLIAMFWHASFRRRQDEAVLSRKTAVVRNLGITDLCLFTDARYTRHPSMADFNTPFQDNPLSFEHFPSGSILNVPPHLNRRSAQPVATEDLAEGTRHP